MKKNIKLKLLKKGLLSTFQDLGKNGLRHLGVNPSGAMDKYAVRLINILLQNNESESVLEMHFPASEILFEENCTIIIGGADFMPTIDNQAIANWKAINVTIGSILKFNKKVAGNRVYLGVKGGFGSPKVENKFLPYLGNSMYESKIFLKSSKTPHIRFTLGNEYEFLTKNSKQNIENQLFTITKNSNRMGFRMNTEPLKLDKAIELVSSAVDFGTIQLLPDGQIIILMADHQTSGGYPRIGNIISVDLPYLAQLDFNDSFKLQLISIEKAEDLLISQERDIQKLKESIKFFNNI
ncbi:5-oxoprolinase subunit C family protein [Emticicia aquatica]|uniref:5-oxoprolinase subunit C family protein n=1 Tax=Emticicia aquatica TaxID=1681835 RepID=UPI001EEAF86E|nr:biotin-dependent carboxyltransferase family protein [Emticicia aquatica]